MEICGYRTGVIQDASRSNWQNNAERPIAWSAWYPTEDIDEGKRSSGQFFESGDVIWNAALAPKKKLPVVLLSHGTAGTAESLGWLARSLAVKAMWSWAQITTATLAWNFTSPRALFAGGNEQRTYLYYFHQLERAVSLPTNWILGRFLRSGFLLAGIRLWPCWAL